MFWLDIVNAAFDWSEPEDAQRFLKDRLPVAKFDQQAAKNFFQCMRFIRQQMAAAHFGLPLNRESINQKLLAIKLEYTATDSLMPALRASRATGGTLRQLEETVFLQFASYLSECASAAEDRGLRRCEGFYKPDKPLALLPDEERWRSEIPEFAQLSATKNDWERCGDFFISARGRFCSEACRARAFQIAKQLNEPEYLAEKQRRYRARKSGTNRD